MTGALALVGLVSLVGAALTLFSGFGLGTLLLPVFALFLPVELAVAATGVVHFLNNVFKVGMLRGQVAWPVVGQVGLPGIAAAWAGASLLGLVAALPPIARYALAGHAFVVAPVKLMVGLLLVAFALVELVPERRLPAPSPRFLLAGGLLSGFFGGLSGQQGALRSMFLLQLGLSAEAYAATGAAIALCVDLSRLTTYAVQFRALDPATTGAMVAVACTCAFLGSYVGGRLLPKVTVGAVRAVVVAFLLAMGLALAAGLI